MNKLLEWVSDIQTFIFILGIIFTIYLIINGLLPVIYRLGMGLAKRKIAIFATSEFGSLEQLLLDSKLFNKGNIVCIPKDSIKKAEKITILLIHRDEYKEHILDVLSIANDNDAIIVYAPNPENRIDTATQKALNTHRNMVIVNFRGRLLNDILTSMITTSYGKW